MNQRRDSVSFGVGAGALFRRLSNTSFLVFLVCTAVAAWRFWPWMPTVFFGDDLSNLLAYRDRLFASTVEQALTSAYVEKYRPLFALIMRGLFWLFEGQLKPYLILNILIQATAAVLMFRISLRLSGNILVALLIALASAASRFSLYQVTQVTGILEGVSLLLFLAMLDCLVRAATRVSCEQCYRDCWLAVLASFMAIQVHERYIVLSVGLLIIVAAFFYFKKLTRSQALIIAAVSSISSLFNVLYKKLVLHSVFFVGTGGARITIDPTRTLMQLVESVESIFGFNAGPQYLIGEHYSNYQTGVEWYLALSLCSTLVLAIIFGVVKVCVFTKPRTDIARSLLWPSFFLILMILMLLPPILTIRVEQRWLVVPFYLLLLIAAWVAGLMRSFLGVVLISIISLSSLSLDSYLSSRFGNIFFVAAGDFAGLVKRDIVDKSPLETYPLGFIAEEGQCGWALLGGDFFRLYAFKSRQIKCISAGDMHVSDLPAGMHVFAVMQN